MVTPTSIHQTDWSTPARSDWVIRERIAYERIAAMYEATRFPMLVGLALAGLCALVLLRTASPWAVAAWFCSLLLLTLLRLAQVNWFKADTQRRARAAHWERQYLVLLLPYTATWSLMLLLVGPRIGGFTFSFVIVGLLGVASAGMYTVQSVFRVAATWLLSMALPVVAWCLWRADVDGLVLGLGTVLFTSVLLHQSLRSCRTMGEAMRLRLENAAIAEDRAQALAQAEQSSQAKTRFLATVSHEMRTPLNGIVGISELLRDEATDPQARERAAIVLASAEQLHQVIGDLLDLSRLEFGRLALDPVPFDPEQALRELIEAARPGAQARGLQLELRVTAGTPRRVRADAVRVRQVLNSLLSTSLRASSTSLIEMSVSHAPQGLSFSLTDNGPVIPPAQLARLFEPFDQTGTEPGAGRTNFGLGLGIARRLAHAMNGDLICQSEPDLGTRFTFSLQAPVIEAAAATDPFAGNGVAEEPSFEGRILVVDDNEVNALVAQAMLERLGLQADLASDGLKALEKLENGSYALALMDCRMPMLDGWEATRQWRERESRSGAARRLPIVGVTANVSEADRQHCLQSGMDGFLAKPFRLQDLANVLRPYLTGPATAD